MSPLEIETRIMTKFAELGGQAGDLIPDEFLQQLKAGLTGPDDQANYDQAIKTLSAQKLIILSDPSIELTTQGSEYVRNFLSQE